jgi:hypothetical protein
MPAKRYKVNLFPAERDELQRLVATGKAAASTRRRAQILLKADQSPQGPAWTDTQMCAAFAVGQLTVSRTRKALVCAGVQAALQRKARAPPPVPRKLAGAGEAQRIALACSKPPAGYAKWTLQLSAATLVELQGVESLSDETVRRTLKKGVHTLAKQTVVSPAPGHCRLCFCPGGDPGSLSSSVCVHACVGVQR